MSAAYVLLVVYGGLGFVLFLAWSACMDLAIAGRARRTVHAANVLAVIGLAHPVAALAAWDLWRQANRWTEISGEPHRTPSDTVAITLLSISTVIAVLVAVFAT